MLYSIERNFCFFHVPKNAGTSIMLALQEHGTTVWGVEDGVDLAHLTYRQMEQRTPEGWLEGAFKFAFVRHPLERVVSAWDYYRQGGKIPLETPFPQFVREMWAMFLGGLHTDLDWPASVYEFVHVIPQHCFLLDAGGALEVDFVGRFETLEQDFAEICSRIGLPQVDLPKHNMAGHGAYLDYYDGETEELVRAAHRLDFGCFRYE